MVSLPAANAMFVQMRRIKKGLCNMRVGEFRPRELVLSNVFAVFHRGDPLFNRSPRDHLLVTGHGTVRTEEDIALALNAHRRVALRRVSNVV